MSVKDRKIGILVSDRVVRRTLFDLLNRNGARVSCVADWDEMELLAEKLGIEVAIIQVQTRSEAFCPN